MDNLRETIELLTKILFENATIKLKAEVFRAAKFDNPEVTCDMWKLLFKLINYCEFNKVDDITERACNDLSAAELVAYVKHEFQHRGYKSRDFVCLPVDMSVGSRELLLAFSWLMYAEDIIRRFMLNCTQVLNNDTVSRHQEASNIPAIATTPTLVGQAVSDDNCSTADTSRRVEQLLLFNNKLRLNLRSLYSVQCERTLLHHKIREATVGVNVISSSANHLSMFEVFMLRHPDVLHKNIELLEQDSSRLRNLLRWKELENIFWKWMESVLEAKQTADTLALEGATQRDMLSLEGATRLIDNHCNLQEAILKYESIVEHLERICQEKVETVSTDDIDKVVESMNAELFRQKVALNHRKVNVQHNIVEPTFQLNKTMQHRNTTTTTTTGRGSGRVIYSESGHQHNTGAQQQPGLAGLGLTGSGLARLDMESCSGVESINDLESTSEQEQEQDIEQEIEFLQQFISQLDTNIELITLQLNDRMYQVSQPRGTVCIPPIKTKYSPLGGCMYPPN